MAFALACPTCHAPLEAPAPSPFRCSACDVDYPDEAGIWRFLRPGRAEPLRAFVERYAAVREREARGGNDAVRLLALPFRDVSGRHRYEWSIRARSFEALLEHVIEPWERQRVLPLRVLDLGSGVGWLAARLTRRGHEVLAIDVVTGEFGLGVHHHYPRRFVSAEAEFDALPVANGTVDLVIFNAAFHYADDYETTLREAVRTLQPDGQVVLMDSPCYDEPASGEAMLRERDEALARDHGIAPAARASRGFLTTDAIAGLGASLGLTWSAYDPRFGLRWRLRPWFARLRRTREPAAFKLLVGRRSRST